MDVRRSLRNLVSLGIGASMLLLAVGCAQQRSLAPTSTAAEPPRIRARDGALGPARGVSAPAREIERDLGF